MKNLKPIFTAMFLFFIASINGQTKLWEKIHGDKSSTEEGKSITVDKCGNVFTTGYYSTDVEFDSFTAKYLGNVSFFLLKTDTNGIENFLITGGGGIGVQVRAYDCITDDSCNVYVAGYWRGGAVEIGGTNINHKQGFFLAKINKKGDFVWLNYSLGLTYFITNINIDLNSKGEVFLASCFTDTLKSSGVPDIITKKKSFDIFVSKYSNSGLIQWTKSYGGDKLDQCSGIKVDAQDNLYLSGTIEGVASFGTNDSTTNKTTVPFVVKLDEQGKAIWVYTGDVESFNAKGFALDKSKNSYISGYAGRTGYLICINDVGVFKWKREITTGSNFGCSIEDISIGDKGRIFVTGYYSDNFKIDKEIRPSRFYGILLAKFLPDSRLDWVTTYDRTFFDYGSSVQIGLNNKIYLTGRVSENGATGNQDLGIFCYKDDATASSIESFTHNPKPNIYIDYEGKKLILDKEYKKCRIYIFQMDGRMVKEFSNNSSLKIDFSSIQSGLYKVVLSIDKKVASTETLLVL